MKEKYELARRMRRALTPPEFLLWERIKTRQDDGPIFRRQYAFGPYILDFYCIRARLAVEVDGDIHNNDAGRAKDSTRDEWLNAEGIEVYRIQAADIFNNADGAADGAILRALERLKSR
jgi:very-short-patch-repair endonuclease